MGKKEMISVGWHSANERPYEVDYVGHSWFLKKDWLVDMVESKYMSKYKYVGEDMCLSFMCQKKEIPTVVPPHPGFDVMLWGSLPKYGMSYFTLPCLIISRNKTWHNS